MSCCRCLNKNAHPEDAENCDERCGFCLGYCSPVAITIIIVGLIISNLVYFALLISRNKNSAWRIVLSIIFILIPIFCGACVLWAYYVILFTSPGYVPKDPWQYRPRYAGDGPGPALNDGVAGRNAAQNTSDMPPQTRACREDGEKWGVAGGQAQGPRGYPTEDAPPSSLLYSNTEGKAMDATEAPTTCVVVADEGTTGRAPASGKLADPRSHSPFDPATNPNPISDTRTATASLTAAGMSASSSPTPRSDSELNPYAVKMLDRKSNFRYCHSCRMFKPDLAHHCSVCGKCVYNFDHHCPYVNNCVGRNNYKVFLVFVLYGAVGCLVALVCAVLGIFVIDRDKLMTKIGWIAIPAVELVLGLALLCFFVQHRCLVSDGETTLDSIIKNQTRTANGWNYWKKSKLSDEEKAAMEAAKQAKIKAHHDALFGDEHPWYRRYLPIPVRTDVTAEDTIKQA